MTGAAGRCAIAIMAKTPRPGRSKTRLCPPLSAEQAAACSGGFLRDMTATIARAGRDAPIDGYVAYAPLGSDAGLLPYLDPATQLILADGSGVTEPDVVGFGRVLLGAMRDLFARGYRGVCVLNADSPTLPAGVLIEAATALARDDHAAVLGPARDGGYYLLGLCAPAPALFAGIAWSTAEVADQTRRQADRAGLRVTELPLWYDVDDVAGLDRLVDDLADPDIARRCPATAGIIAALDLRARSEQDK